MSLNTDRNDNAALALLYLPQHDYRAWKGLDWDVLGRLHGKGMLRDPVDNVKSVAFTQEGLIGRSNFRNDVRDVGLVG